MKVINRRPASAIKWHGGKFYMAPKIVGLFPPHKNYVEPFAGGLNVLLSKPRSERESAGDIDADLTRAWRTIRDSVSRLVHALRETAHDEETFNLSESLVGHEDDVTHTLAFMVRNRMSRAGLGKNYGKSSRLRRGMPEYESAWESAVHGLQAVAERLRGVDISCGDAVQAVLAADSEDTLFYLDPPYLHATRSATDVYRHEMTDRQHGELLDAASGLVGKVFISGYRSDLYDDALSGWSRHDFPVPNHSGQGKVKQKRVECLWENRR